MSSTQTEGSDVTVVIPACNAAVSLETCLDSVFAQTRRAVAVIVVDDGSTDDTPAVARRRGDAVRVLAQANRGPGAARNAGAAAARTAYVAFLDADDTWAPEFLAQTTSFLDAHPAAIAVSTAGRIHGGSGTSRALPVVTPPGAPAAAYMLPDFFKFWADYDHVRTGTVLLRRVVMLAAGGQREDLRISQDLEYWGYLATFGPWGYLARELWHGHSRAAALAAGWRGKYAQRRRLCPTVAAWEARLAPRIAPQHADAYRRVRGRVASGYLHAKILAGDDAGAREIWMRYAAELPRNRVTQLLRLAQYGGDPAWRAACRLLVQYETWQYGVA